MKTASPHVTVLVPAHNEESGIAATIEGLRRQTTPPDQIVVVADNCTDATVDIARSYGVEVFVTVENSDKKAGALNQALRHYMPLAPKNGYFLLQDADSVLSDDFIENALRHLTACKSLGAVGGVFAGSKGGGFVGHLQRNEYARYARDVNRMDGRCLVVTGTAALFRTATLERVSKCRLLGILPPGDGKGGVYDTTVLTEDNELSFALLHLGYKIKSPTDCTLVTEVMESWRDLWKQRLRWKRGAVENCVQYGLTRITARYWGRQILTGLGVLVTFIYLSTIVWALSTGGLNIHPFWIAVTGVFVVERVVTVRFRGWRQMILSASMYELIIDMFLQIVHAKAYADAAFNTKREW